MPQWADYHSHVDFSYEFNERLPGVLVPQKSYTHPERYARVETIYFEPKEDGQKYGVLLSDALGSEYLPDLKNPTSWPLLGKYAPAYLEVRLEWPGCAGRTGAKVPCTGEKNRLTTSQLAHQVAKYTMRLLLEARAERAQSKDADYADWKLKYYPAEKLALIGVRHVGPSLWQPILCAVFPERKVNDTRR